MGGKKVPGGKAPSGKIIPASPKSGSATKTPVWRFDKLDMDGKFAFDLSREDFRYREVLQKIMDYSRMKWQDIEKQTHDRGKSKHHFLKSLDSLSPEARERIRAKHLEEHADAIFSFAFENMLRVIGIREGEEFHVVWYDPKHEFCPSRR